MKALSWLLGSQLSVKEFFEDYFEKEALLIQRDEPEYYGRLYGPVDIEQTAFSLMYHSPQSIMTMRVGEMDPRAVTVEQLDRLYLQGSSMVFNKFDRVHPAVFQLCRDLQESFPFVFAVSYLTPPNAQAAPPHNDDQDIFILQVSGEKHWTLYKSETLIYTDEMLGKDAPLDKSKLEVYKDFTMKAGDMLYMPRGVIHECHTNPDDHSLHITVTLQSSEWTWGSLYQKALRNVIRRRDNETDCPSIEGGRLPTSKGESVTYENLMRGSFAMDFMDMAEGSESWVREKERFDVAKELVLGAMNLELLQDILKEEVAEQRRKQHSYINKLPVLKPHIDEDTVVRVAPGFVVAVSPDAPSVTFTNPGGGKMTWSVMLSQRAMFEFISDASGDFSVGCITGSDGFAKICVARLLLEDDVLHLVKTGPGTLGPRRL